MCMVSDLFTEPSLGLTVISFIPEWISKSYLTSVNITQFFFAWTSESMMLVCHSFLKIFFLCCYLQSILQSIVLCELRLWLLYIILNIYFTILF